MDSILFCASCASCGYFLIGHLSRYVVREDRAV